MSKKKKYLIELYLKCSKYLFTAEENFKANEEFLKASFPNIKDDDFDSIIREHGISQFIEKMTSCIDSQFSEEEVQSLIDFFTSSVGRKLVNKSHLLEINTIFNNIATERQSLLSRKDKP